jgi:hypothetical protein
MKFARLFPPGSDDPSVETCTLGSASLNISDVKFDEIPKAELPDATWVDGGSAVLFKTPSRAIGIVKVCQVKTQGLKRQEVQTHSYLVSITANGTSFLVCAESLSNPHESVTSCLNREIPKSGLPPETTPEMLLDPVRMLAERCITGGIVIYDGSTRTLHPFLQKHMRAAPAIAKTTSILTSKSRPIGVALLMRAPAGVWQAKLGENIVCVRLHASASHIFMVEQATDEILSLLHAWSADMAFPGYPYPLVLADQLARVTNNERDAWKLILASDEDAAKILSGELRASDAHAVFEHILYGKELL